MLEVITPAANKKLTTVSAVKEELGIPDADMSQDALISLFIDRASDAIVTFCSRPFAKEGYRETVPGYGSNRLILSRTPIVEITSVIADSEIITDYLLEDPEAGILFRRRGWQWAPTMGWNITWHPVGNSEDLNFTVEYTAGYVLPGDQGTRTLPNDIEKACIETVKAWYLARERDPVITAERIGDYQASYAQGLPAVATQLLAPWRRII
jgi:hypothetical protein